LPPDDMPPGGGGGKPPNSGSEDLLDPKKPLRKANPEEITPELLEEVKKRNAKIWVGDFTPQDGELSKKLGFDPKYPVKITFSGDALKHINERHGEGAILVKKGQQPAVTREDIINYKNIVNNADRHVVETDKYHQKVLIAGKQINGYMVVVETISTKKNELKLKTIYKEYGKLENNKHFAGKYADYPKIAETSLSPKPSVSHALTHTADPHPTTPPLKKPSIREQALAFRQEQKRREQEALEAKEAKYKAERQEQEQAYQASLAQKESQAGTKENQKDLKLGTPIAMQRLQGRSSSVSLDDDHIYPLDFVVVKAKDIKPSFNTGVGTQTRTQTNSKMVEQIAQNFKPEMVLNRGGFDDLPLILSDGQVIAGNHRAKGMQDFTPQSRHTYEQAILEHYGLELKGDELLVRTPKNELDTQEIINLASASNKERAHTYGDKLIAALGKYDSKITPDNLENYLKQSHDVQELAQNVGRALDTQAKEPDIEGANLALLAQSARNTQDYTLSKALNDAQKTLDIEDFSKLKEMLVKNAGSFYTLLRDSRLPNLHLAPYLTQSIPSMAHALKTTRQENFTKLYETLSDLLKTTDEHGINALVKMNPGVYDAMASELLGVSLARFVRLENPAQSFYEFLKNAPEGLNALVADTLLKRIEGIPSKPLNEANVYDFITLAIESGENTQIVSKVKDLLPEFEKKAREAKKILKPKVLKDKELISKSTPTTRASKEDLTEEFLEEVKRRKNDKVWIGDLTNPKIIEHLGFDPNKPIKMLFDGDALIHIEKRHGRGSPLVESSGQPAIKREDIISYPDLVNHADLMKVEDTSTGKRLVIGKQINGYAIVVEAIGKKNNQLSLKTIYKEHGRVEKGLDFKDSTYIRLSKNR
uniref:PBECR3 domain-containing polyvalent protein n=1 Tax=Helicobacter felis TaxID=214 RepID=UPI00131566A8